MSKKETPNKKPPIRKMLGQMKSLVSSIREDESGQYQIPEKLRELWTGTEYAEAPSNLKVLPFLDASVEQLIAICKDPSFRQSWYAVCALCVRGDATGLTQLLDACPNIHIASGNLSWALWPLSDLGDANSQHPDVVRLLVAKGAAPEYRYGEKEHAGGLLSKAIRYGASDEVILALIEAGASIRTAYEDLRNVNSTALERTFFGKADKHVVTTHKILQYDGGVSLKRVFDFEAKRVIETLGNNPPIGYAMHDVDAAYLDQVRKKLLACGGDTMDYFSVKRAAGNLKLPRA